MISKTLVTLLITALVAQAQNVTQAELTQVDSAYAALGFAAQTQTGFGLTLTSQGLLTVTYSSLAITNGNTYTAAQVAAAPTIVYAPLVGSASGAGEDYTLILADAASLTIPDPQGNFRHYLASNVVADANGELGLQGPNVFTQYAGPGPLPGSGVHRYAWLLFSQGPTFAVPAGSSATGITGAGHWNVSTFVNSQTQGLTLIAASFFQVAADGSNSTTTTTSATSSASRTASSSVTSSSTSSSSAAATSTRASSAGRKVAGSVFGLMAGAALVVVA